MGRFSKFNTHKYGDEKKREKRKKRNEKEETVNRPSGERLVTP